MHWDGDGRKDLLIGLSDGRVKIYLNIGTDDAPTFDEGAFLLVGMPGSKVEIDVGERATPSVVDWNDDGKKDVVAGAVDGKIRLYINTGTDTAPSFRMEEILQVDGEDLVVPSERSSPVIRDFDDDHLDILTGNTEGQLLLYSGPGFSEMLFVEAACVPIDLADSARSRPFVCDWDGDELLDVLVGAGDGLVHRYPGVPVGDINFDGVVDVLDFLDLLAYWGQSGGPGDVNKDGIVNVLDFLLLLANWT